MYNVTRDGYPAPKAPLPNYFSQDMPRVCSVCHFLLRTLPDILAERERLRAEQQISSNTTENK